MHMIKKYISCILLLYLMHVHLLAQTENASLFTGHLSYSIPVYTLEDPDFHLDIALRYSSEGFKPFQPSGSCGQDWTLFAGGCITRSVQGVPDDQKYGISRTDTIMGMLRSMHDGNIPDKEDVFNMVYPVCDTCGVVYLPYNYIHCYQKVDYLSDIFYFNFCGYKGRFMINNQGQAVILSGDFVKIDLSQLHDNCQIPIPINLTWNTAITIQTKDGYTYVFGGHYTAIEYSLLTTLTGRVDTQLPPAATAWHLRKVIAPNGRTMTFNYNSCPACGTITGLESFITDYDWSEPSNQSTHITYSLHKDCLLQSIMTSDSLTVSFYSSEEAFRMYEHDDFTNCVKHLQLDSIKVTYRDKVLRKAHLSYQYRSSSSMYGDYPVYNWRYLSQVTISGVGRYAMTYDNISSPFMMGTYPTLYPQTDAAYKNMVDRFGFWKTTSLQGMLREVSLPTGGKMKFTYENHQYGTERKYLLSGTQDVVLSSQTCSNQSIGGARIKKIETLSNASTVVESKTFSYNKRGAATSSGIFYNIFELFDPQNSNESHPIIHPNNYGMIDSHIGYSYVLQETTVESETYKTAYTFDAGIDTCSSASDTLMNRRTNLPGYSGLEEVCSGSLTHSPELRLTGKLVGIEQYRGNTPIKTTLYKYNGIPNTMLGMMSNPEHSLGCTDTIVVFYKYEGHVARKLLVYPDVLERSITYEYEGEGDSMVIEKTYTHDRKLRKKEEFTMDSRNRQLFTRYTYPDDLTFPLNVIFTNQPPLFLLQQRYQINTPIEVVSGYIVGNDEYITNGTINIYAKDQYITIDPSNPMGQIHDYPYLYRTMSLALSAPISDYTPLGVGSGSSLVWDTYYRLDTEYSFDYLGRLLSIKPYGKQETRYTWNGLYPATKTIGNQTYTYTYIPYVGIQSSTDPRGITTYYSYDSAGRLIEEYQMVDGKKQILHVYQYHIKTE